MKDLLLQPVVVDKGAAFAGVSETVWALTSR